MGRYVEDGWPVLRLSFWAAMIVSWFVEALSHRHSLYPDGMAYLDIASACMKGQWTAALNGYWSPAYPVLVSLWLRVFHPSAFQELPVVKCFNCLALVFAAYCFVYFLQGILEYTQETPGHDPRGCPLPSWALRTVGYTLFFWISLYVTPPSLDTPDVLVFAAILMAAGILVRMAAGADSWLCFAALGTVLGLGYLAKAVMFPLGFVFLGVAPLAVRNIRRAVPRFLLALALFSIISLLFLFPLSKSKGRFTFGDSPRINYAEYVNGANLFVHWQGKPSGSGTPKHPTRQILETPAVYEYASPIAGTYPPWNDPSYWYDGVRPHFELKAQANALSHSLDRYFEISTRLGSLIAGFVVLVLYEHRLHDFLKRFWSVGFLWIPAVTGFAMYALIVVYTRYLGGFLLLLWAGLFSAVRVPRSEFAGAIVRCVALAIVLLLGVQIGWSVGRSVVRLAYFRAPGDLEVAHELIREGIMPGDKVAFVGFNTGDYWARLAKVSIVAEASENGLESFWGVRPESRAQALNLFAKTGAKAVVTTDVPPSFVVEGWRQVAGTSYFVRVLPSQ